LFLIRLFIFFIYNDSRQTNYFKIYRTNLRQIFRVDRTMAVDDQPEISFFRPSKDFAMENNLCWFYPQKIHSISVVLSTELICWMQAASGAARRANVGLYSASSL